MDLGLTGQADRSEWRRDDRERDREQTAGDGDQEGARQRDRGELPPRHSELPEPPVIGKLGAQYPRDVQ